MSRIEEILEKATQLREKSAPPAEAPREEQRPVEVAKRRTLDDPAHGALKTDSTISVNSPYLVSFSDPASPVTEEYKKLKSIIMNLTNSDGFNNTLMVTSTLGGEGKSITALNLAISLAQEYDHTVVLVDTDLRRPMVHNYLGIRSEPGLSDCLLNGVDVSNALVKTGIGKLSVLPAGTRVSNPVELISSSRMKDFIKELKSRYPDRYVIIDTPPVLHFAEAHAIGSVVDGVIFVVREGYVPVNHLKEALNILKGTNILGAVYNDVDVNRYSSYYHYYNHSYYSESGAA